MLEKNIQVFVAARGFGELLGVSLDLLEEFFECHDSKLPVLEIAACSLQVLDAIVFHQDRLLDLVRNVLLYEFWGSLGRGLLI